MNVNAEILPSGSRTVTSGAPITNPSAKAIHVILDVTVPGTGSITLSIYGVDKTSGKRYLLLAGAAVTTLSTNVYKVGPGLTAAANAAANDVVPRDIYVEVVANNANAMTYSVGSQLVD